MSEHFNRRRFLKKSFLTATGVAAGLSMEESILKAAIKNRINKQTMLFDRKNMYTLCRKRLYIFL